MTAQLSMMVHALVIKHASGIFHIYVPVHQSETIAL